MMPLRKNSTTIMITIENTTMRKPERSSGTDNRYHAFTARAERTLCLDDARGREPTGAEEAALRFNAEEFDRLLRYACVSLARAKALHDELEAEYIPRMNFDGVEECWQKLQDALPVG